MVIRSAFSVLMLSGVAGYPCNPSTREVRCEDCKEFRANLGHTVRACLKKQNKTSWYHICYELSVLFLVLFLNVEFQYSFDLSPFGALQTLHTVPAMLMNILSHGSRHLGAPSWLWLSIGFILNLFSWKFIVHHTRLWKA